MLTYARPRRGRLDFEKFIEQQIRRNQHQYNSSDETVVTACITNATTLYYIDPTEEETLEDYICRMSLFATEIKATRLFIPRLTEIVIGEAGGGLDFPKNNYSSDELDALIEVTDLEMEYGIFWFAMMREGDLVVKESGALLETSEGRIDKVIRSTNPAVSLFEGILP